MTNAWVAALKEQADQFAGELKINAWMSEHTTWKIGGPADCLMIPANMEDLVKIAMFARQNNVPLYIVGHGSNLLVSDSGLAGIVVKIGKNFSNISVSGNYVRAEAGASITKVAQVAADNGLAGLAWAAGIPGTVGGAIRMNAGAYGGNVAAVTEEIEVLDVSGDEPKVVCYSPADLNMTYRHCELPDRQIVIAVNFLLQPGSATDIKAEIKQHLADRSAKHPLDKPNAGSVFKNPTGQSAAKLIESAGLKGESFGQAQISEKHANFIVNNGNGTADDVLCLIRRAQRAVKEEHGIELVPEVRIWGNF